jgi:pimeloyl-ACP methyl ester carboxylesterase
MLMSYVNQQSATLAGAHVVPASWPVPEATEQAAILLVHGFGGAPTVWTPATRHLQARGIDRLSAFSYDSWSSNSPALGQRLGDIVKELSSSTGRQVHVLGHSLGGVLLRFALLDPDVAAVVGCAVTIASPHSGVGVARLAPRGPAVDLRPGSPALSRLAEHPPDPRVRWTAYAGELDALVRPRCAMLPAAAQSVTNVLVPGEGHLSILQSPRLWDDLSQRLASCAVREMPGIRAASNPVVRTLAA